MRLTPNCDKIADWIVRQIEDLWRITLSQIPSVIGQLAYLASLRHPNTGVYHHAGLEKHFGEVLANEAMHHSHRRIFRHWLALSLEDQRDDCELYWSGLLENRSAVMTAWITGRPYVNWVPALSSPAERDNFELHMGFLLEWFTSLSVDA